MPNQGMPTPELAKATTNLEKALEEFTRAFADSGLPNASRGPLFEALRQWRTEQARAKQVPPYIVASDAVLRAIEDAKPRDLAELQAIRGFGPSKATTYGEQILEVVAKSS